MMAHRSECLGPLLADGDVEGAILLSRLLDDLLQNLGRRQPLCLH